MLTTKSGVQREIAEAATHRLITVMTLPRALSPYSSILLYTPMCSMTLTMASGVQGRIDLTVPAGGVSETAFLPLTGSGSGTCEAGRGLSETGWMNRMLVSVRFSHTAVHARGWE